MKISASSPATEWRSKVAHGETVGWQPDENFQPWTGRQKIKRIKFLPPRSGAGFGLTIKPTVSPWATFCRASGALTALVLFLAASAMAQTTNTLSDAEIQGRLLAQKILSQRPAENTVNTGVLQIHDGNGNHFEVPIVCRTVVTIAIANTNIVIPDWRIVYQATLTNQTEYLWVIHATDMTNIYSYYAKASDAALVVGDIPLIGHRIFVRDNHQVSGSALMSPFAGSDFWLCDLGLEFFHWPQQKVLKKEFHRQCACTVLESTNPNPTTNSYSRVVSWIDEESLGIVEAYAYDVNGKKLKNFYPKNLEKVNGQYQVQTLVMDNVQTGSRSRLEFDLKK